MMKSPKAYTYTHVYSRVIGYIPFARDDTAAEKLGTRRPVDTAWVFTLTGYLPWTNQHRDGRPVPGSLTHSLMHSLTYAFTPLLPPASTGLQGGVCVFQSAARHPRPGSLVTGCCRADCSTGHGVTGRPGLPPALQPSA